MNSMSNSLQINDQSRAIKIVLVFDSNIGMVLLIWLLDVTSKKFYLGIFSYFFT